MKIINFIFERIVEQLDQQTYLESRTSPILTAKGKEGELRDARISRIFNQLLDSDDPLLVSFGPPQPSVFCPAAITVHDDSNMIRPSSS